VHARDDADVVVAAELLHTGKFSKDGLNVLEFCYKMVYYPLYLGKGGG